MKSCYGVVLSKVPALRVSEWSTAVCSFTCEHLIIFSAFLIALRFFSPNSAALVDTGISFLSRLCRHVWEKMWPYMYRRATLPCCCTRSLASRQRSTSWTFMINTTRWTAKSADTHSSCACAAEDVTCCTAQTRKQSEMSVRESFLCFHSHICCVTSRLRLIMTCYFILYLVRCLNQSEGYIVSLYT